MISRCPSIFCHRPSSINIDINVCSIYLFSSLSVKCFIKSWKRDDTILFVISNSVWCQSFRGGGGGWLGSKQIFNSLISTPGLLTKSIHSHSQNKICLDLYQNLKIIDSWFKRNGASRSLIHTCTKVLLFTSEMTQIFFLNWT